MIFESLKRLDAYPKTLEDVSFKTFGGAILTIVSSIIIFLLVLSEFNVYMSPNIQEELFVDTTRSHKLKINLDFYIPKISCDYISLDAMDSAGEQHLHIDHNIYKRRLDLEGNPIEEAPKKEDIQASTKKLNETEAKKREEEMKQVAVVETTTVGCGSCYGATINGKPECCNTCKEVIDAYRTKQWEPLPDKFEQCKNDKTYDKNLMGSALMEGCQVYGYMEVNRMGGSFHIAPGKSFSINHIHVHDVQPYSSSTFNTSHTIKHLSFGEKLEIGNTKPPLDNHEAIATEGAMMFQYYIKIVPTMYVPKEGPTLYTNQFSVTKHQKSVTAMSGESGMPGIFLNYELSPLMLKYTEKSNSFGHFLTSICAIVGGIFTVAGIIDSLLHNSLHALKRKIELGKFS